MFPSLGDTLCEHTSAKWLQIYRNERVQCSNYVPDRRPSVLYTQWWARHFLPHHFYIHPFLYYLYINSCVCSQGEFINSCVCYQGEVINSWVCSQREFINFVFVYKLSLLTFEVVFKVSTSNFIFVAKTNNISLVYYLTKTILVWLKERKQELWVWKIPYIDNVPLNYII